MRRSRTKDGCGHHDEITVSTAWMVRHVCETCGRLRIAAVSELMGPVDRRMFARPADELHTVIELRPLAVA
ncbi:MAG: hypothetical protein L0Z63_05920 [Actinobacteria bacterium]|nr:hypothetical protein [Actinomycetota bacterium]